MAGVQGGEDVYVTLLLNDPYLPGALVLAHSLRDAGTTKKLAVMVTLDTVSAEVITQLKTVYDYILPVPRVKNDKPANLYLMNRPDLHSAFTKINLWKQTQFRKVVYIDADVVAYRAPDELFDITKPFSAAPDIGWPDLFNTGVMVLTPNIGDYYALMAMAERGISFDGADQGLLNMHFKNSYHRLPFTYNVTPSAHYQYIPAYRHFQSSINMVHFIGSEKPWLQGRDATTASSPFDEMVGRWWAVYDRHYRKDVASASAQQPPALVQHFVKGEYQPMITYRIPIGEPPEVQERTSHGQHYEYPPQSSHHYHHHHEAPTQQHPPPHEHHHHHHPPQQNYPGQSQPAASLPHSEQSFSTSSASFSSVERSEAEARPEQVPEPQQGAPPPPREPEQKPEPPQPPPMIPSWDAQRYPPPSDSKPEAMNFPQVQYEMSSSAAPFVPPERYPSPPRNMWYEVPKEPPAPARQRPPPIFPWEAHRPRTSRVFANDEFQRQPSVSEESRTGSLGDSSAEQRSEPITPTTPTIHATPSDPWTSFSRTNAWDDVPQIERYVDALQQHRRTRSQGSAAGGLRLSGLGLGQEGQKELQESFQRRGSKVTDFPSEAERPSLPVTPAPIRRPKFWGGGAPGFGDEAEEDDQLLPAAEGVPRQTDWVCVHGNRWTPADCLCDLTNMLGGHKDPVAQLQKLARQQSEVLLQKLGGGSNAGDEENPRREIPTRPLPFGSEDAKSPTYIAQSAVLSPQPVKPGSSTTSRRTLSGVEHEFTPRTAPAETETVSTSIAEPSYHGPGVAWEKGEDVVTKGVSPAPPTEEEKDVLET